MEPLQITVWYEAETIGYASIELIDQGLSTPRKIQAS